MRRVAIALFVFAAATGVARADVYGYVDDGGTLHLATEPLDARYTLFIRSGDARSAARVVAPTGAPLATPSPTDPDLMKTRLFQRLVDHPNIAKYEPAIRAAASRHGLDPQFVKAVIAVESGFEPTAVSQKGAVGLMQVLPSTGERYGLRGDLHKSIDAKLADPVLNLEIGTRYLADLKKLFVGRPDLVLAAYNAGENAVIRYRNAVPPFPETQAYVKLVDQFHAFYDPPRGAKDARARDPGTDSIERERIRVTIPARRNLPDPNLPLRLPAPTVDKAPVTSAASSAGTAATLPAAAVAAAPGGTTSGPATGTSAPIIDIPTVGAPQPAPRSPT